LKARLVPLILVALALAAPVAPVDRDDQEDLRYVYADPGMGPEPVPDSPELRSCWDRIIEIDVSGTSRPQLAGLVVHQLLATPRGRGLVSELCDLFRESDRAPIEIALVDQLPDCRDTSDGCFAPMVSDAASYRVHVRTQDVDAAREPTEFVFGEYPANPECSVIIFFEWAESAMAQTLYHELLHIWFLRSKAAERRHYPTGHGEVSRCEFEEDFLQSLRAHAYELAAIEGTAPPLGLRVQPTRD
jgi:hypothetical protein